MMEFALCNLIWREKKGGGFGFEAQTHFSNQVKKREREMQSGNKCIFSSSQV